MSELRMDGTTTAAKRRNGKELRVLPHLCGKRDEQKRRNSGRKRLRTG